MARFAVLVPPPRVHTIRYFGVWAPRSKLRRQIVPASPPLPASPAPATAANPIEEGCDRSHNKDRYRMSWARALKKVFELDLTVCPRCHQKGMQQVAVIHDPRVLRAMLASIERDAEPP